MEQFDAKTSMPPSQPVMPFSGEYLESAPGTLSKEGRGALAPWASVCLPPDAREFLLRLLRDLRVRTEGSSFF